MDNKIKVKDLEKEVNCTCEQSEGKLASDPKPTWGYHSYSLNKDFRTLTELREAEEEAAKEKAAKEEQLAVKRADAKKVEDAYKALADARVLAAKSIKEAEEAFYKARAEFVKKYGSYHMTYSSNNGDYVLGVSDMIDTLFGGIFDIFK